MSNIHDVTYKFEIFFTVWITMHNTVIFDKKRYIKKSADVISYAHWRNRQDSISQVRHGENMEFVGSVHISEQ